MLSWYMVWSLYHNYVLQTEITTKQHVQIIEAYVHHSTSLSSTCPYILLSLYYLVTDRKIAFLKVDN